MSFLNIFHQDTNEEIEAILAERSKDGQKLLKLGVLISRIEEEIGAARDSHDVAKLRNLKDRLGELRSHNHALMKQLFEDNKHLESEIDEQIDYLEMDRAA